MIYQGVITMIVGVGEKVQFHSAKPIWPVNMGRLLKRTGSIPAIMDGELETTEPYTFKYLKLMVLDGDCEISNIYLREYVNPGVYATHFASSDMKVNRVFEAGRETFRQNAVDIFMDCPSRERAGYLCDCFFTSRVAFDLLGKLAFGGWYDVLEMVGGGREYFLSYRCSRGIFI